jgi:hypothetical protein
METSMNTLMSTNTRHIWIAGLAAVGLAVAAPVQAAAPDFMDGAFMVAKRERSDEARQDRRDDGRETRREAEREEPRGYGYGYERRRQQRDERIDERIEEDDRPRGRR